MPPSFVAPVATFVATMVKLKPPRSVGVPMIVPAALFNESPGGSDPAVTAQVTVRPLVWPVTPREPEYGAPTVASVELSGSTDHSSAGY